MSSVLRLKAVRHGRMLARLLSQAVKVWSLTQAQATGQENKWLLSLRSGQTKAGRSTEAATRFKLLRFYRTHLFFKFF